MVTPCRHWFCGECIRDTLEANNANNGCPMCRRPLGAAQLVAGKMPDQQQQEKEEEEEVEERAVAPAPDALDPFGPAGCLAAESKGRALIAELQAMRRRDPSSKALIFSQYADTMEMLKRLLRDAGFGHCYIDGAMSIAQRTRALESFQSAPPMTVFLLTLRTGAVGLNLTSADHVFLLEASPQERARPPSSPLLPERSRVDVRGCRFSP